MTQQAVLYPGTFDPITHGHTDVVMRASAMFDEVIVAIAKSTGKQPIFPWQQRIELAEQVLADYANVTVQGFDTLLADFAKKQGIKLILRGLRAVSDFEHEFQLASMNRHLGALETILMASREEHTYISSSSIREIASLGGDISSLVHPCVQQALYELR